jgi:thiamine kinase-like enzyme
MSDSGPPTRAIVDRLAGRLGPVDGDVVPLEGGITNRNFRVRFGDDDYVVRLPGKDTALLGIDRETERLASNAAAALGIAPAAVFGDADCLVTRFVSGVPIDPDALRAHPGTVARALRKFHDSGATLPVRFWVPELLSRYALIVAERGASLPEAYTAAFEVAGRIAEVLPLLEPVPCHNDLLGANVLSVGDAVMLVDWEYAGMGHRLFDLGNLAVNNDFDGASEEALLRAYLATPPDAATQAALRLMRVMSDAREGAWGVVQSVVSELEFDFDGYAARHFERLERAAADPSFEEWLDAAAA